MAATHRQPNNDGGFRRQTFKAVGLLNLHYMIDYFAESEKYKPDPVKTLLIGETPPPSGEKYFYVPRKLDLSKTIAFDSSLPSTIFYHYFKKYTCT